MCDQQHDCHNTDKLPILPKRVLDLGDLERTPPHSRVRLYETSPEERARWATLSHCWGKTKHICTTVKTLHRFKRRIHWSEVSVTYRDAIYITRRLGIRYLWIDSMCIIQDDKEDWRIEAAKMADIYRHSYITIAATSSPDGNTPILKPESCVNRLELKPRGITQPNNANVSHQDEDTKRPPEIGPAFVRKIPNHDVFSTTKRFEEPKLLTRAWVYQERILSPRVIHFYEDDLIWECNSDFACQCGYIQHARYPPATVKQGRRNPLAGGKFMTSQSLGLSRDQIEAPRGNLHFERDVFRDRVSGYGRLDLTYPSDRLPAIAGIAFHRQSSYGGRYLAGLWDDTLAQDLTWQIDGERPSRKSRIQARKTGYIAPSWSWASVERPYYSMYRPSDDWPYCWLKGRYRIGTNEDDKFGQCTFGYIELDGLMKETNLILVTKRKLLHKANFNFQIKVPEFPDAGVDLDYRFDRQHFVSLPLPEDQCIEGQAGKEFKPLRSLKEDEDVTTAESVHKFAVFLLSGYAALLLRKAKKKRNVYSRVGLVTELTEKVVDSWLDMPMSTIRII